jgi:predicted RecB family nuclease
MKSRVLSKSAFIKGKQCEKSLWLHYHQSSFRDKPDELRRSLFDRGHKVGLFARQLFPGGVDSSASAPAQWAKAVEQTKKFIQEGREVIYEAAFEYEHCLVFADLFVKSEKGWKVYEVKSSLRTSENHLHDAAFQYHVIRGAGHEIEAFHIVHPNPEFVLHGQTDAHDFFVINDISEKILPVQNELSEKIKTFKLILDQNHAPLKEVGTHCQSPYPCDFKSHCWGKKTSTHILNLPGVGIHDSAKWLNNGIRDIKNIPGNEPLSDFHRQIIRAVLENRAMVHLEDLRLWFEQIKYPLAFFDLEMFMPAIPIYEGTKPFEHLPFAYSMRKVDYPGAPEQTVFFMAPPGSDPRPVIGEHLLSDLHGIRSLVVFDNTQEHAVFRRLADRYPEKKPFLERLCSQTADMAELFVGKKVYFPSMGNSFSLKSLAADAGVHLDALRINNGYDASSAYENLHEPKHLFYDRELREDLRHYSMADTEILAKVFFRLENLLRENYPADAN